MSLHHLLGKLVLLTLIVTNISEDFEKANRFAIKVDKNHVENVRRMLEEKSFKWLNEITPETFVIQYNGKDKGCKILRDISGMYPNKLVEWQEIRIYDNTLKPADITSNKPDNHYKPLLNANVVCEKYYGMNIEDVWKRGYTGKEVTIGITDVGLNIDLLDLKNNVESSLSYNFIAENDDVAPDQPKMFHNYKSEAAKQTEHGNNVASIVAAEKDNYICSAGIAFNSTLAALKIFEVQFEEGKFSINPRHLSSSHIISNAFVYKLHDIDIFVNAWSLTEKFDTLDILTRNAIELGAVKGRFELGRINLVPAGPTGNGLSNSIYTITVGGISRYGTKIPDSSADASILTSGLSDGNSITSSSMVTTVYKNKCVSDFKGLSAATAQIGGIIALGLEANSWLSLRDVQHLLVQASDHDGLNESGAFRPNGAHHYVHSHFGFGLLNASKFVDLATDFRREQKTTPELLSATLSSEQYRSVDKNIIDVEFCFDCVSVGIGKCVTTVEHVLVSVHLQTINKYMKISVISPSGTESVLMDESISKEMITAEFVSTHFWDEWAVGDWKVRLQSINSIRVNVIKGTNISFYGTHSDNKGRDVTFCKQTVPVNDSSNANREQGISHTINDPVKPEVDNLIISLPLPIVIAICVSVGVVVVVVALIVAVVIYLHIRKRGLTTTGNLTPPEITGHNQDQQELEVHGGVRYVPETRNNCTIRKTPINHFTVDALPEITGQNQYQHENDQNQQNQYQLYVHQGGLSVETSKIMFYNNKKDD